jgi:hypothetical protein
MAGVRVLCLTLVLAGCAGQRAAEPAETTPAAPPAGAAATIRATTVPIVPNAPATAPAAALSSEERRLVGSWRTYSLRIFYDAGGASNLGSGPDIELRADGTWRTADASGRWSTAPIADGDWKRWGLTPYGPTNKIVLERFFGSGADGPIETSGGRVDFFWAIYRVGPPTISTPGLVHAKYGH